MSIMGKANEVEIKTSSSQRKIGCLRQSGCQRRTNDNCGCFSQFHFSPYFKKQVIRLENQRTEVKIC